MKPLIGINLDIADGPPPAASVQSNYYQAVLQAGGIPVLIPPMPDHDLAQLLGQIDGLILVGGDDYSPALYGEKQDDAVKLINCRREEFDLRLVRLALERAEMPVLGICGGMQLINISLGGSLIQDIPSALPQSDVKHSKENCWQEGFQKHQVAIEAGTELESIYRLRSVEVASSHHQAVKVPAPGLKVSACADDGVIEAVELPGRPFVIAVQWHPERDYATNKPLFQQFIRAGRKTIKQASKAGWLT